MSYTGKDFARSFRTVRKNTIQIANDIPEDKYGFRVTGDTRTAAEILAHIAASATWQREMHGAGRKAAVTFEDFGGHMQKAAAFESKLKTKAEIIKALETEGDTFAAWLDSLGSDVLTETVNFPAPVDPPSKTRFEMLLGVKEHEMHHRAQLMVMQRVIGQKPHLTAQREAMMAARQ